MAGVLFGLVVVAVTLVARFHANLPVLISGISYSGLTHSLAGQIVIALNVAALLVVLRVTRGRTVLDLGIALAVLASTLDAALTLKAASVFRSAGTSAAPSPSSPPSRCSWSFCARSRCFMPACSA